MRLCDEIEYEIVDGLDRPLKSFEPSKGDVVQCYEEARDDGNAWIADSHDHGGGTLAGYSIWETKTHILLRRFWKM